MAGWGEKRVSQRARSWLAIWGALVEHRSMRRTWERTRMGVVCSLVTAASGLMELLRAHVPILARLSDVPPLEPWLAFSVLVVGLGMLALPPRALARAERVASVSAVLVIASGLFVLLRFVYDEHPDVASVVSWTVAFTPLLAGLGLLAACGPSGWPTRLFLETSVRGLLLRWLLPAMVLVVLATDFAMAFLFAGYSSALGSAVNMGVSIAVAMGVIKYLGRAIEAQLERQRSALRASEEKFRTLFDTVPAGLALSEFETGQFVDVNEDFQGCSRRKIAGRRCAQHSRPANATTW